MNHQEVQLEMKQLIKYKPYLDNFFHLTRDERNRVLAKHPGFNRYYELFELDMIYCAELLRKALECGPHECGILMVESLESVFK